MIPYLLAAVGGYLIAQSRKPEKYAQGGEIAQTILNQLGGPGRLTALTGAYNFVDTGNGVSFRIKNPRANFIKITLNGKDLYDIEVGRIRANTYKVLSETNDVFFDQMKPILEKATGFTFTMPRVRFDEGGVATESRIVTFGKHRGKTLPEIFAIDPGWVRWFYEKYKTEPFIDFRGNSRMPKLTPEDQEMKVEAAGLLGGFDSKKFERQQNSLDTAIGKGISKFIGKLGDRIAILGTVISRPGAKTIFLKDDDGNVFYIYDKDFGVEPGKTYKITGTVTKQWERDGEKVTYLNRPKVEEYEKPADWMFMEDGGIVDNRFTFRTDDDYDSAKRRGYFDFDAVEVDVVDKLGREFFFQPKSEEEYKRLKNNKYYTILVERPVELYFDAQEYYDPGDDREERDDDDDRSERDYYKKGGKVKKLYAVLRSPMGEPIADIEVESMDVEAARKKFNEMGMFVGSISFTTSPVHYYAEGGMATFDEKVSAISKRLVGTKVPERLKKDYGTTYDSEEAKQAAKRIAGAQLKKIRESSKK